MTGTSKAASKSLRIHWLQNAEDTETLFEDPLKDLLELPVPMAPSLGQGRVSIIEMALGMTLIRSTYEFAPEFQGKLVLVNKIDARVQQPSFAVGTIRGGRLLHLGQATGSLVEEGFNLFNHFQHYEATVWCEGNKQVETVALTLQLDLLKTILGAEEVAFLFRALDLERLPSVRIHKMPKALGDVLRSAAPAAFAGASRQLFAQARSLEYLSVLYDFLRGTQARPAPSAVARNKVLRLKDYLLNLEGKLPKLELLALEFDMPARRLNEAFAMEFGESIYGFISGQRLDQARSVLEGTDLPLKLLADRLGYSHVNHFITAFRKRFGQSPGRLRRGARSHRTG